MKESDAEQILNQAGAVITNSHIVYTSFKHGTVYIDKDAVYPDTEATSALCHAIAERFEDSNVEAVVAPEKGGIILSQWVAFHLSQMTKRKVLAFYAEKTDDGSFNFVIKRRSAQVKLPGKNVLVVEDILTTGGSARKVIEVTRALGAIVVGLGVICNRGGVKREDVADVPRLEALLNVQLDAWNETDCLLCKDGVPINTDVGKGREFLAGQRQQT